MKCQVHFLVRENLLAIDELRDEHDKIYQELHDCFGLERCRKQENFLDWPPIRKKVMFECVKSLIFWRKAKKMADNSRDFQRFPIQ